MQPQLIFEDQPPAPALPFADYTRPVKAWNGIVLVGEAPGAEEARQGRPFVGRSGQLLDKVLDKAGIDRAACLIANVFRYQPPGNKVDHFFISKRAATTGGIEIATRYGQFGSAWCRAAFAAEIDHLAATLAGNPPKITIALGRTPLWALTGLNGLTAHAGQIIPCRLAPVQVMPTFHPSFILRGNWILEPQWLAHFAHAAKIAQ